MSSSPGSIPVLESSCTLFAVLQHKRLLVFYSNEAFFPTQGIYLRQGEVTGRSYAKGALQLQYAGSEQIISVAQDT